MIQQTEIPNLDICGLMARDRNSSDLFLLDTADCPCDDCEGMLAEAWERMTFGGVSIHRVYCSRTGVNAWKGKRLVAS